MRIDLYLKTSRLIKRRKIANDACVKQLILIDDIIVKPSANVCIGQVITMNLGAKQIVVEVTSLTLTKDTLMYKLISEKYINKDKA